MPQAPSHAAAAAAILALLAAAAAAGDPEPYAAPDADADADLEPHLADCEASGGVESPEWQAWARRPREASPGADSEYAACWSRREQHCYRTPERGPPSRALAAAFAAYRSLHARCAATDDIASVLARRDVPHCKYLVWTVTPDGVGNRVLSLVSTFAYALLTGRVLLLDQRSMFQELFCEPFPFSSWLMPPTLSKHDYQSYELYGLLQFLRDREAKQLAVSKPPQSVFLTMAHYDPRENLVFFCPSVVQALDEVPILFLRTNQYFLPALHLVPHFREQLQILFPDGVQFMHLSRVLMNPTNDIWDHVTAFFRQHLSGAARRLGIQVRTFKESWHPLSSVQLLQCAVGNGLLPDAMTDLKCANESGKCPVIATVLTSLHKEHFSNLTGWFAGIDGRLGTTVRVVSPGHEQVERSQDDAKYVEHERQVVMEIWLLSLCNDLVTSPFSTFGYCAHSLAGDDPAFADPGKTIDNLRYCVDHGIQVVQTTL
eukprot:SM000105S13851  [mRNA]  locus=s105:48551:51382:+ [translate_table: standard]